MKKKYTVDEFLLAAEIGEVSMIDARHTVSLLDEARNELNKGWSCRNCIHSFMNPFDEYFCGIGYKLNEDADCEGEKFEKRKK